MNEVPVPNTVPVVDESANQLKVVPAGAVALKVTAAFPQLDALTETVTAVGNTFNVAVTAVRVADKQPLVVFLAAAYSVLVPVVVYVESNVNDPLLSNVPAVAAEYQSIVSPAPAVAEKVTNPAPHLVCGVPATGAVVVPATESVLAVVVPQPTTAFTLKVEVTYAAPKVTLMLDESEVADTMVTVVGNVQLYLMAPVTVAAV